MNSRTPVIATGLGHAVKAALVGALLAGCPFDPRGAALDGARVDDAGDGPIETIDAIDGTSGGALCDLGDANLILCVSFDGGTPLNQATANVQAARTVDVSSVTGRVGSGGGFGDTTVLHISEDSRLDLVQPFAFEMFVRVDEPPLTTGSQRIGLLDNNGQYSLFANLRDLGIGPRIYPYCSAQATVVGAAPLVIGTWHHLACVQDAGTLAIYVDGVVATIGNPVPISTNFNQGTTIGQDSDSNPDMIDDPLIGAIDELRLWRGVARSNAQIQAAAARR